MTTRPIWSNVLWIPKSEVDKTKLRRNFTIVIEQPENKSKNDYVEDQEQTKIEMWGTKEIKGSQYIGLPTGDWKAIEGVVKKKSALTNIKDKRPKRPLDYKLKWSKKFPRHEFQVEAVNAMFKAKRGVLYSKPRTGKTAMATDLFRRHAAKTIIFAHQHTLLDQFLETFYKFTNIKQVEREKKRKLIGICQKLEDFYKYDICLATYQQLLPQNGGAKKLKAIRNLFEVMIVDEVHRAPAFGYINVLSTLNVRYRYGLTGTPDRKDGLYVVTELVMGGVSHKTSAKAMVPKATVHFTGHKNKCKQWVYITKNMAVDPQRNELIVNNIVRDIKKGHHCVVPVTFTEHANFLVKMINTHFRKPVAIAYTGKVPKPKRKPLLQDAVDGKTKCVVAMRNMLLGVNVPNWSALHNIMPISNDPNMEQELNRVCTPMEGKLPPVVRMYVDDMKVSWSCFASCVRTFKRLDIHFTKKSRPRAGQIFDNLNTNRNNIYKQSSNSMDDYISALGHEREEEFSF